MGKGAARLPKILVLGGTRLTQQLHLELAAASVVNVARDGRRAVGARAPHGAVQPDGDVAALVVAPAHAAGARAGGLQRDVATCEERDYKGLHAFPSNITRDDPPITRDDTPFLQTLQGMALQLQGITLPPF